jgi:multiple sugar transport system substrate-binding protein
MNLSKTQLVMVAVAGVVVIALILVFLGIIPGLQDSSADPTKIKASLNFWGVGDTAEDYADALAAFKGMYPNVVVNYRSFGNEGDYESALLNALAENKGPDIFMVRNTDVAKTAGKIAPALGTTFSALQLRQMFPQVASQDLVYQGLVNALPLSIDTLALLYNRDAFDQAAVTLPVNWKSWEDLINNIPNLVKKDGNGRLTQAAVALGTARNITNTPDILYMLMLQNGVAMNKENLVSLSSDRGVQALDFYRQFSQPGSRSYSWNNEFKNSLDAFANGEVAMVFEYASNIPAIKNRNGFLNFEIAPVLQPKGANLSVTYPKYWGYVVSRQSKEQVLAWSFVITMTTQSAAAEGYSQKTGKPPALNSLIYRYQSDPVLGVFARQALTARSWFEADRTFIDRTISDMIELTAERDILSRNALQQTEDKINQYLNQRSF